MSEVALFGILFLGSRLRDHVLLTTLVLHDMEQFPPIALEPDNFIDRPENILPGVSVPTILFNRLDLRVPCYFVFVPDFLDVKHAIILGARFNGLLNRDWTQSQMVGIPYARIFGSAVTSGRSR